MTENSFTETKAEPAWHKVSPWALVYFVVHFSVRFIKDGLLNLLPMLVVFVTQVENKLFWGQIAAVVIVIGLLLYSLLYFLNFKFCISPDNEILLNKGVFKKERITLKFDRVQNVNIATPFYFAPVNLVNCIFDAAGSVAQEVVLPGVTAEYAAAMRKQVFAYKEQHTACVTEQLNTAQQHDEKSLVISNKEVAKFGLMSNMAILAFAAMAPFYNVVIRFIEQRIVASIEGFYQQQLGLITTAAALAVATLFIGFIIIVVCLSVAMALIRFYNFELYFKGEKFKRIAGLLERHQLSMSLDKMQSIVIKQNIMSRLLKRYTFYCLQASSGGWAANAAKKNKQTLILPVLNKAQVEQVCQWIYPWFDSDKLNFTRANRALLVKNLVLYAVCPSLVLLGVSVVAPLNYSLSVAVAAALAGLVILSYRGYGYCLQQHDGRYYLVVRKGMIGVQYRVFELYKAQSVQSISTYFMRKSALKSLHIQLAAGVAYIPYITAQDADYLMDFILLQAESDSRNWM